MTHECHIYAIAADMAALKMCAYPPSKHALPHWKCVLHCCDNFPHIDLQDQESDRHNSNASTSISFHIYHLIALCTLHGGLPTDGKKIFSCVFKTQLL